MQIPWELFPTENEAVGPALDRAAAYMDEAGRPYALLMQKAASPHMPSAQPRPRQAPDARGKDREVALPSNAVRPSRADALREVVARTPGDSTVVLASTDFAVANCTPSTIAQPTLHGGVHGLRAAACAGARAVSPDLRVVALDGDGAALMRMERLRPWRLWTAQFAAPAARQRRARFDGRQATVSPAVSFGDVASACGYASALETDSLEELAAWLDAPRLSSGRALHGCSSARVRRPIFRVHRPARSISRRASCPLSSIRGSPLMLLLNPGPVTLTERVRRSLLQPDLCHRESEFFDLQDEARARLLATHDLDPKEWTAVLMTASGTAAVESMVAALVREPAAYS